MKSLLNKKKIQLTNDLTNQKNNEAEYTPAEPIEYKIYDGSE